MYDPSSTLSGSVNDVPVELIDIYPTLMELTGITPPSFLAGQSLASMLTSNIDDTNDLESLRKNALTQGRSGPSLVTDVTGLQGGMTRMR